MFVLQERERRQETIAGETTEHDTTGGPGSKRLVTRESEEKVSQLSEGRSGGESGWRGKTASHDARLSRVRAVRLRAIQKETRTNKKDGSQKISKPVNVSKKETAE